MSAVLPLEKLTGKRWAVRIGVPSAGRGEAKWTRLPVDVVVAADGTARVIDRHTPSAASAASKRSAPSRPLWRRAAGRVKRSLTNQWKKD